MRTFDNASTLMILSWILKHQNRRGEHPENAAIFKIPSVISLPIPLIHQVCSSQNTWDSSSSFCFSFSSSSFFLLPLSWELKVWPLSCREFRKARNSLETRLNYFYTTWTLNKRKCGQLYKFYTEKPSNTRSYQRFLSQYIKVKESIPKET